MLNRRSLWALSITIGFIFVLGREGRATPEGSQHGGRDTSFPSAPQQVPIRLSPGQQQLIGITYGTVERRPLTRTIRTVGRVEYDERKLADVNLKITGWIQDLYVDYTGKLVEKGQPLFTIYSPDLVTAQEEYLLAIRTRERLKDSRVPGALESAESLVRVSRSRLHLWDLTERQIHAFEEAGEPKLYQAIYAPVGGFVIEKVALKGQRVKPGMTLYKIADLSTVWVHADIYEHELPFIREGQEATVTLSYYSGEVWRGKVDYIYPYLDTQTRTNKVRFVFANSDHRLKPGMYANVDLQADLGQRLIVPESAVLHSGVRKLVFVDRDQGLLEPRAVTLGMQTDGYWEVLDGLKEGERIVTSGNFLIDSESKLAAAESMMGMMGAIGMGDWKMESAKPMEMGGMQGMEMGGEVAAGAQEKRVGSFTVRLSTLPETAKVGDNTIRIRVQEQGNKPVTNARVSFTYTMDMPGMTIEEAKAVHRGEGLYEGQAKFTMAGPWSLVVTIQAPGQEALREKFTVRVAMP